MALRQEFSQVKQWEECRDCYMVVDIKVSKQTPYKYGSNIKIWSVGK